MNRISTHFSKNLLSRKQHFNLLNKTHSSARFTSNATSQPDNSNEINQFISPIKFHSSQSSSSINSPNNSTSATHVGLNFHPELLSELAFDSHELVEELEKNGFNQQQAVIVKNMLIKTNSTYLTILEKFYTPNYELALLKQKVDSNIESLKKDMIILEKSEFSLLRSDNEKVREQMNQASKDIKDQMSRLRSNMTVEFSLEKSRNREEFSKHQQDVKDTNNRIETEMAKVRKDMELQKSDLIKYIVGSSLSLMMCVLAAYRFIAAI